MDWDDPKRDHGDASSDFAVIAADVQARGLEKPGSSGDWQITVMNPGKSLLPKTVYVGKRRWHGDHPPGEPWYVEWETPGPTVERARRVMRFTFASPVDVICWLRLSGF